MRIIAVAGFVLVVACVQIGCQAPPPPRPAMSLIWLPDVSEQQAFAATREILREFDFRLDADDPDAGYLRTYPVEQTVRGGTGRISDPIIRSPNRVRRIAEAYLRSKRGGVEVRLAVSRERQDTATYRAYAREHQEQDMPTETPIDRETGTSPAQYESWTPIGRDRQAEADIRRALEERLTRGE